MTGDLTFLVLDEGFYDMLLVLGTLLVGWFFGHTFGRMDLARQISKKLDMFCIEEMCPEGQIKWIKHYLKWID